MTKQVIYSPKVTRTKAPHAHAVKVGNLVFVSGCPAYFGEMQLAKGDFPAQMRQCLTNLKDILEEAGSSLPQVVKVNVFLDRRADFDEMNEIYREFFGAAFSALLRSGIDAASKAPSSSARCRRSDIQRFCGPLQRPVTTSLRTRTGWTSFRPISMSTPNGRTSGGRRG